MFPELSRIVHDYARPCTRPDWRRLHKYTHAEFTYDIEELNARLYFMVYYNSIDGGFLSDHNIKNRKGIVSMTENKFVIYEYGIYTYYSYITENVFIPREAILYRNTHILTKELYFWIDIKAALMYCGVYFILNKIESIIIIREMFKRCFLSFLA